MTEEEERAYQKAYYEIKKEKLKAYYQANKEDKKAKRKAYYKKNKEKEKAYKEANKEREKAYQKAYQKAYREANKEKMKAYNETYAKTEKGKECAKERKGRYLKKLNLANAEISQRTLQAWAVQVKERDGNMCQLCFSTKKLHAHHILSKSKHPTFALLLNNGVTLCEACHIEEHRLNGDI